MKSKFFVLGTALIGAAIILSSFKSTPAETGSITVTVMHGNAPSPEALVGVSTSEENRENSEYIAEGEANSAGVITFKSIAPGTYYLDAASEDYYGEAEVTVTTENAKVKIMLTDD